MFGLPPIILAKGPTPATGKSNNSSSIGIGRCTWHCRSESGNLRNSCAQKTILAVTRLGSGLGYEKALR